MLRDIAGAVKGTPRAAKFLKTQGLEKAVDEWRRAFEMTGF
jgi:hypothetical protein